MSSHPTRRRYLRTAGTCVAIGLAGCTSSSDGDGAADPPPTEARTETQEPVDEDAQREETEAEPTETPTPEDDAAAIDAPPGRLASVPVPAEPERYEFPTMGTGDAPVTARFCGGYKCRYTRRFVQTFLPDLVERFVEPGRVDVEFHAVGYRPSGAPYHGSDGLRAARAGFAVWYHDPGSYWNYFEHVFENMERSDGWATTDTLTAIMTAAEVDETDRIEGAIESGAYESQIDETMDLVSEVEFETIPRIVVDGEDVSPNVSPPATVELLEQAIEDA